ncbi:MAG: sortase [Candidatus Peribacteria bacterium]|jgi:sortase (surface protein transpeptidase)|nr:sortase [Candidatus Peribacteria bacterium]
MDIPEDRVNYLQGKTEKVNINTYLQNGVLHYPGSVKYGENGNAVIMGHSSYFNQDRGRYKTVFQAIIGLNQGDAIWIYQKNAEGKYERYEYIVETSFET